MPKIDIKDLRKSIALGKLDEASERLVDYQLESNGDYLNEAIHTKSRLSSLNAQVMKGVITPQNATITKNQIGNALLDLLTEMMRSGELKGVAEDKMTVLFVTANPYDETQLRISEEMREVEATLQAAQERDNFELKYKFAARIGELQDGLLNEKPEIVHFSGHGVEDGILVMDQDGNAKEISNDALAGLFQLFKEKMICVLLNSCYSENQAQVISQHIPYVIGMQHAVPDSTAVEFSRSFYKALGAGNDIPFAFNFAKNAIQLHDLGGAQMPVLLES